MVNQPRTHGGLLPLYDAPTERRPAYRTGSGRAVPDSTAPAHWRAGAVTDAAYALVSVAFDSMVFGPEPDRMSIFRGGTTGLVTFFTRTRSRPLSASASTWSAPTSSGSWKVRRNAP